MPRPFRSRGPKDAPPPYDNPPPYHVAISMESMPNDDLWSLKTASNPNTLSLPRGDSRRNRHQSSQTLSNRTPGPPGQTGAADIERVPEDEGESGVEIETNNEDEDSEIQIENAVEEGEIETNSEDNHIFRAHVVQVIAVWMVEWMKNEQTHASAALFKKTLHLRGTRGTRKKREVPNRLCSKNSVFFLYYYL